MCVQSLPALPGLAKILPCAWAINLLVRLSTTMSTHICLRPTDMWLACRQVVCKSDRQVGWDHTNANPYTTRHWSFSLTLHSTANYRTSDVGILGIIVRVQYRSSWPPVALRLPTRNWGRLPWSLALQYWYWRICNVILQPHDISRIFRRAH